MENKTDIRFNCAYWTSLNTFTFKVGDSTNIDDAIKKLKCIGIKAKSDDQYLKQFKIAESFLLPDSITQQCFRLRIDGFSISFSLLQENCSVSSQIKVDTFLTLYPKFDIGILIFNMHLENRNVDELIFLSQCFDSRFKIHVDGPDFIKLSSNKVFIGDILLKYIKLISSGFGLEVHKHNIFKSKCIEIRSLSNLEVQDSQTLLDRFPRQIYGLLTSDEGWRFVPKDVAIEKTNMKWRTRNFILVIPLHFCVLLINLDNGNIHQQYVESQDLLRNKFGYPIEEYFTFKPNIAGLNHGPLLTLEIASIHYYVLDQVLNKIAKTKPKGISDFLNQRDELVEALSKLAQIKIREIGILGQNIEQAMSLATRTEDVNKRLEQIERTLIIKYDKRINFLIILLTIFGIIVALFSTLESIKNFFA